MKYQVGQNVYTARKIRGWFNFSVKDSVPINTCGTIKEILHSSGITTKYLVCFGKEFGELIVQETDLKLG